MDLIFKQYTVLQLVQEIKQLIESNIGWVKVIGEVGSLKKASSGHLYFNLKEKDFMINAVLFSSKIKNIVVEDGFEVIAIGRITTYESRSNYQIIIESIEINGEGQLQKIVEERKAKLEKEGLFDKKYKKPIKKPIKSVGLITSATGAAIKDIEVRLKERMPINVYLYDSLVQGILAEDSIIKGIEFFNSKYKNLDAIVISRGGGFIEDLMCFSGEKLARAIFNSQLPIITAIGHEIDWSIADYVADLRLPTPTAVAEYLTPLKSDCKNKLDYVFKRILLLSFKVFRQIQNKIVDFNIRIKLLPVKKYLFKKNKLSSLKKVINKFNKNKTLKNGFAMIFKNGKWLKYKNKIFIGDELIIRLYKKEIKVKVIEN